MRHNGRYVYVNRSDFDGSRGFFTAWMNALKNFTAGSTNWNNDSRSWMQSNVRFESNDVRVVHVILARR